MVVGGPYRYEVVPVDQALVTVAAGVSYHKFPYGWPIPSNGTTLNNTGDSDMLLIQQTAGSCTAWEGSSFIFDDKGGGTDGSINCPSSGWCGYSGAKVSMGTKMPNETCAGVQGVCGENFEGNLTYYEATHGAQQPILHTMHMESPSGVTCDAYNGSNCIPVGGRLRLHASYPQPSDPNAAAVITAMKTYGISVDDNGSQWAILGLSTAAQGSVYPSSVVSAIGSLRLSDFDVVSPNY